MQVVQACGPFRAGQEVYFNTPQRQTIRYIKLGVQAPQVPPMFETIHFPEDNVRFFIQGYNFVINANDILEFEDLYTSSIFTIKPLQDMDAYTIIDVAFMDELDA